jgi:hypothetical protein
MLRLAATAALVFLLADPSIAQDRSERINSARAARLHALAGDLLPKRLPPSDSQHGARGLLSALNALSAGLSLAEAQPTALRLSALGDRRRSAEAALESLRQRMKARGAGEDADQLGRRFNPIWQGIDAALSGPTSERSGKLLEVRAHLAQARAHAVDGHGSRVGALPLGAGQ